MYHIYVYAYQHIITCKHRHSYVLHMNFHVIYTYIYAAHMYCMGTYITYSTCMEWSAVSCFPFKRS